MTPGEALDIVEYHRWYKPLKNPLDCNSSEKRHYVEACLTLAQNMIENRDKPEYEALIARLLKA